MNEMQCLLLNDGKFDSPEMSVSLLNDGVAGVGIPKNFKRNSCITKKMFRQ